VGDFVVDGFIEPIGIGQTQVDFSAKLNESILEINRLGGLEGGRAQSTGVYSILRTGGSPGMANPRPAIRQGCTDAANGGGGVVLLPAGFWNVGGDDPIDIPSNVIVAGLGRATQLVATGSSPVFRMGASGNVNGAGMRDFAVNGAAMTAGEFLQVLDGSRLALERIISGNLWNFLTLSKTNVMNIRDQWHNGMRGTHFIRWWGDDANRSDVLDLQGVTVSGTGAGSVLQGIDWDGNCHTCAIRGTRFVNAGRGIFARKSAGATSPAFLLADGLEVDFPDKEAIRVEAGTDLQIDKFYAHGSRTEHNIFVASGLGNRSLIVSKGKISGAWKAGVNTASRVEIDADVYDNSKAAAGGYGGIEIESGGSLQMSGGMSADARQSYGVIAKAGAVAAVISSDVDLRGNASGDFLDTAGVIRTGKEITVPLHASTSGGATWTNMPIAATLMPGSSRHVMPVDLRGKSQVRLIVNRQAAGSAGSKLALRFNTTGSFTAANFNDIGASAVEVAVDAANQVVETAWIELSAAAKLAGRAYLGLIGYGTDGAGSPGFGNIHAEFR